MNATYPRLMLVGNPQEYHMGGHLISAAKELGIEAGVIDTRNASRHGLMQKIYWKVFDHRPLRMARFQKETLGLVADFSPNLLLATGLAPLEAQTLNAMGRLGIIRANFLTDDPLNPSHKCKWFLDSLKEYDILFSPRRSNISDLIASGAKRVVYVPFGYNPQVHYCEDTDTESDLVSDVLFVGGGDADRTPIVLELIRAGLDVALYGSYWDRIDETRPANRGVVNQETLRRATNAARVTLILVRRANRDGHVMRSFEAAASGGCLLVEDTQEHREIFEDTVVYFDSTQSMIDGARALIADSEKRDRLKWLVNNRIVENGSNCYRDRLHCMLQMSSEVVEAR